MMRCQSCLFPHSLVYGTVRIVLPGGEEITKRYRRCPSCGAQWPTFESCDMPDPEAAFQVAEIKNLLSQAAKILA